MLILWVYNYYKFVGVEEREKEGGGSGGAEDDEMKTIPLTTISLLSFSGIRQNRQEWRPLPTSLYFKTNSSAKTSLKFQ